MQGPHSPVALQWHRVQGSHPDWRGQARGQRSTRYHFTLKREETEVGNYRLRDLGSPAHCKQLSPLAQRRQERPHSVCPQCLLGHGGMGKLQHQLSLGTLPDLPASPCVKPLAVHCWGGAGGMTRMSSIQGSKAVLHQKYTFLSLFSTEFGVDWVHGVCDMVVLG